jgi:TIR domain
MPFVPGFKYDLFVSYAHKNDRPWRWVSEFVETLKDELEGKSRDFNIWWDPGLRTGEDFNIAIGDAISESAVFLSVLSLAYGDSTYCKREIEEFRQQRHPAFGIKVGSMSRMQAVVIDRDFTPDRWAPEFRVTSPCPFYNDRLSLFSKPAALASSDPWIQGLWKVRDSIWATLQEMKHQKERGTAVERSYDVQGGGMSATPVVCVAEVTDELYRRREGLRSALSQTSDFQIKLWSDPGPPPASGPNVLPVHMFGKYPGRGFGDSDLPLSRLQLEATVQTKPARRPLAWFARDLNFDDAETEEHRDFLKSLQDRSDIELLRMDFEDLKEELQKRMRISTTPAPKTVRQSRESPIVHIWHTIDNPAILSPLKQYLNENDCGISVYNCTSTQMEKMQSKLAICDGLIVPYTPDTRTWAEDVLSEAFRLRRREERPTAFAAVELPPSTDEEFNFEHPRVVPVHVKRPDTFAEIGHFLAKLEQQSA